jgi:hypothetical protein
VTNVDVCLTISSRQLALRRLWQPEVIVFRKSFDSMRSMEGRANRRILFVVGVALLFVLASLSGCGGSDGDSSSQPLTRAQFIKRASAICFSEEERKSKQLEAASKLGKNYLGGSKKELTELIVTVGLPLYEEMIEELAALKPPANEQAQWDAIVQRYEEALKEAEATPAKQITDDSFVAVNVAATKYGVNECSL